MSSSRRILITGLSTYYGGRLAQALEADPEIETVIGVDPEEPTVELERAEYVRVGTQHGLLRRIVQAAEIDTVVDTRLIVDSGRSSPRAAHEANVVGTTNILAACSGADSPVRKVVVKSSAHYYGAHRDDPAFFTEDVRRPRPVGTGIERDVVDAEDAVRVFGERHPETTVTVLRFTHGLGPDRRTSHTALLSLPVVLGILGFDPRFQFIHQEDVVGVLEHAVRETLPGPYNAAADGVLALSEVASLLGKPYLPVISPVATGLAASALRPLGVPLTPEVLDGLRYGRGLDNRRLKASGYELRFTSRETVQKFAEHLRVRHLTDALQAPYRYEREVEAFLRYSPSVSQGAGAGRLARLDPRQLTELARMLEAVTAERGTANVAPGTTAPSDDDA